MKGKIKLLTFCSWVYKAYLWVWVVTLQRLLEGHALRSVNATGPTAALYRAFLC